MAIVELSGVTSPEQGEHLFPVALNFDSAASGGKPVLLADEIVGNVLWRGDVGGRMGGAVLAFFLSRSLFRPTVERLAARRPRLRRLDSMIVRDGWKLVCKLRISPIMPFAAASYMLGLSSIGLSLGTLADAGLSAWTTGADPVRWTRLGVGGLDDSKDEVELFDARLQLANLRGQVFARLSAERIY